MPSSSSSKRPNICHHILSMMVHPSPLVPLIMGTSQQGLSKMLSVDMQLKPVTMFLEDSGGIVTDYLLNMKSTKNSKSPIKKKFSIWELKNIIITAVASS